MHTTPHGRRTELMAPAGGPDAAIAAFRFGADAVYLGLQQFSARAEAENFSLDRLDEIIAFAHSFEPRRRVYVAVNTLMLDAELPRLADVLVRIADLGADALIVQDAGVARIAHRHVPELRLHASTQMAVHTRAGVEALRDRGFARATLARELTLDEIAAIAPVEGIEVECFVHGALCCGYSGLCLYSSLALGRSGNRGRCAYLCRDRFAGAGDGVSAGRGSFRFSMKDLALPDHVGALVSAGVDSLKIEGRMKSPLYVAATTNYYRRLLDGPVPPAERRAMERDIQSIFSRPWTDFHISGRDGESPVDPSFVGHRGTLLGRVEAIARHAGSPRLRFTATHPVERHDGLQIDVPGHDRPFGFPVDHLFVVADDARAPIEVFEAQSGDCVEVGLPPDAPAIPLGATVYGASSQAVKRRYRFESPKPGLHRVRRRADLCVELTETGLAATARLESRNLTDPTISASASVDAPLSAERKPGGTEDAIRRAFEKLGETRLSPGLLTISNPSGLFGPASSLNELRRRLAAAVEEEWSRAVTVRADRARADLTSGPPAVAGGAPTTEFWRIKIDSPGALDAFEAKDWNGVGDVIVDIGGRDPDRVVAEIQHLADMAGRDRVRIALPVITRSWDEPAVQRSVDRLLRNGWTRWEISNISGLRRLPATELDISGAWPLYTLNREAARAWTEWGLTSVTLSPEDGFDNLRDVLTDAAGCVDIPIYEDVPLFLTETRACTLDERGPVPSVCGRSCEIPVVASKGGGLLQICRGGRTALLGRAPLCWAARLGELRSIGARRFRVAFVWRTYTPDSVRNLWRSIRDGRSPSPHTIGNFDRGLSRNG